MAGRVVADQAAKLAETDSTTSAMSRMDRPERRACSIAWSISERSLVSIAVLVRGAGLVVRRNRLRNIGSSFVLSHCFDRLIGQDQAASDKDVFRRRPD